MKISIGPIPCFWEKHKVFDFYRRLEQAPVDIVYLGETVCSKRRELRLDDWLEIAATLEAAGKEVVLSTLTLLEAESELSTLSRIAKNGQYTVEANDMAAVQVLSKERSFVVGPHINTYNSDTLDVLHQAGARRWVIPVELGRDSINKIQRVLPVDMETEMLAFGHLPLAFSARCYTARAHNRAKDQCEFVCLEYPDGIPMKTQEKQAFLILNGTQTQSARTCNLLAEIPALQQAGIDILRLMPQAEGFISIIAVFRSVLDGDMSIPTGLQQLEQYQPYGACNGYWYGDEGMALVDGQLDGQHTGQSTAQVVDSGVRGAE